MKAVLTFLLLSLFAGESFAADHCDSGQDNVLVMLKRNINMRVKNESNAYKVLTAPLGSVFSINCRSEQTLSFDGTKYSAVSIEPIYFPPTIYGARLHEDGLAKVNSIIKVDSVRDLMIDIGHNYAFFSEKSEQDRYKLWGSVSHIASESWTVPIENRQDFVKTVLLNGLLFDPHFNNGDYVKSDASGYMTSTKAFGFESIGSEQLVAARCWAANINVQASSDPNYVCWNGSNVMPKLVGNLPANYNSSAIVDTLVSMGKHNVALPLAFTEMHPMVNGLVDYMKVQANRVYDYKSDWIGFRENWQIPTATPAHKWFSREKERSNAAEDLQKGRYMKCNWRSGLSLYNERTRTGNKARLCKRANRSVYRCLMYVRKGFEAMGLIPKDFRLGSKAKDLKANIIAGFKKVNNLNPEDKVIIDLLDPNDSAYSHELASLVKEDYVKKSNGRYKTTWDKVKGTQRIKVPGSGNRCLFPKGTVLVYKSLTSSSGAGHVEIKTTPSANDDDCKFISDFVADGKHLQRELTSAFIFDPKILDLVEQKVSSEEPGSRKALQYAERIKDVYIYRSL